MTPQADVVPANALRAAVISPRGIGVAIVGGLSALGGAIAGAVAALIAASVLTPTEPLSAARLALMEVEYGFVSPQAPLLRAHSFADRRRRVPWLDSADSVSWFL